MNATATPVGDADSPIPRLGSPTRSDTAVVATPVAAPPTTRPRRSPAVPRVDRVNRIILTLLGLLLLGSGVVVLLAGQGVFGDDVAERPVLTTGSRTFAADHWWFWPVVGVAAGLLVALSLAWLWAQRSTGRLPWLYLVDDAFGRVRVDARAFTAAVENDIAAASGVQRVQASLLGRQKRPRLRIVVAIEPETDISRVRVDIEQIVLPRVRGMLARPDLETEIEIVPNLDHGARVH